MNNYKEWLSKQPEVIKRIKEFQEELKTMKSKEYKLKYLREKKHEFDTEFSKKYYEMTLNA